MDSGPSRGSVICVCRPGALAHLALPVDSVCIVIAPDFLPLVIHLTSAKNPIFVQLLPDPNHHFLFSGSVGLMRAVRFFPGGEPRFCAGDRIAFGHAVALDAVRPGQPVIREERFGALGIVQRANLDISHDLLFRFTWVRLQAAGTARSGPTIQG